MADWLVTCSILLHVGVATLTVRELFEFTVDPSITEANLDEAMDRLMSIAAGCVVFSCVVHHTLVDGRFPCVERVHILHLLGPDPSPSNLTSAPRLTTPCKLNARLN